MIRMTSTEPALIAGVIQAGLALGVSFGIHLTQQQEGSILAASAALMALMVRTAVTPNVNVPPTISENKS